MTDNNTEGAIMTFEEIYTKYHPKLVRFSNEYIFSIPDAENIVQDCFVYLWEHQEDLYTIRNINAFLFRLVKNKCVDYLRNKIAVENRKEEFQYISIKEAEYKLLSIEAFDDSALSDEDIEKIIYRAIDNLPGKCKEIFVMSKINKLKYEEIAELLNVSTNTVRNQIAIALKKMRKELKELAPILLFMFG